ADKQCKQFLLRLHKRRRADKSKFRKVLSYLFRGICASSSAANKSVLIDSPRKDVTPSRRSCIANIHTDNQKDKRIKYPTTVFARPMPSAPRRPSSLINEEFLTSDNTDDGREIENKITENEDKPQARLRCKNFKAGPMDARNRKVYEAKLAKLEVRPSKENGDRVSIRNYCPVLQKFILNVERGNSGDNQKIGQSEELLLRNHFTQSTPKQEVEFSSFF
uniref:Uncharacterized protein n=1 Tax=Meloidogyne javanica TaxID=6303 RepID=A0A915MKU3_MELJA